MSAFLAGLAGIGGDRLRLLLASGALRSPAVLTRAQVTATATAIGADGTTFGTFAANVARYAGTARRLLVEGQRTNSLRNPRCEGATAGVIGAGGVAPTNWVIGAVGGIAWEVVSTGSDSGINYVRLRLAGTSNSTSGARIAMESISAITAAVGQSWTNSHFVRLVSGAQNGMTWQQEVREYTGGSAGSLTTGTAVTLGAAWQRVAVTRTLADAGTTAQQPTIRVALLNATTYNLVLDLGWPQAELGAFASSPILPPAAAPAASTRGADTIAAPLSALSIPASGACTVVGTVLLPQAAPAAAPLGLLTIDDGTANNRYLCRCRVSTAQMAILRTTAGVAGTETTIGTMTPGTPFRWGISIDATGRMAGSFNGATAVAITGGPTSGLTTLRLGNNLAGTEALFGEMGSVSLIPAALSDTALAALVAAQSP
ncbi:phage head spike fiber domain-containing protein [Falsiroseomonas ponticola]|uniref:phage head spike fiber domain-containing protein n=1 Tax=Falsiroseomonas ponticola TaxID=2786951 RepID=UPI0019319DE3|nr:hypothetical protein [Roseomonas ponticola]